MNCQNAKLNSNVRYLERLKNLNMSIRLFKECSHNFVQFSAEWFI